MYRIGMYVVVGYLTLDARLMVVAVDLPSPLFLASFKNL